MIAPSRSRTFREGTRGLFRRGRRNQHGRARVLPQNHARRLRSIAPTPSVLSGRSACHAVARQRRRVVRVSSALREYDRSPRGFPTLKSGILPDAKSAFLTLHPVGTRENPRNSSPRFMAEMGADGQGVEIRPTEMLPLPNSLRELPRTAQFFARFAESGALEASQIRASMKRSLEPQSRQPGQSSLTKP